jgi:two-component system sensor histidine kinase PilS (NtrC family)
MSNGFQNPESDLLNKLKWLMFFRVIFAAFLLGSTIIIQLVERPSTLIEPLLALYGLTAGIFILSFCYTLILFRLKREHLFAYVQIGIDTCVVTLIIYITGGSSSIFSFLYLVVIIYSSMLLFRKGSMVMAALCSIQYTTLAGLNYFGFLLPFVWLESLMGGGQDLFQVLFKTLITMVACFAVAFLSSFLSEQERRTKKELRSMENHMKRVEKMAALGEMASGLAHEIKNPLASLTGSIQLMREDHHHDPLHDKLMRIILREADRLSSLVGDFLLYARPPAGTIESIQLDSALTDIVELFEKDEKCAGRISITTEFSPDIWVAMDPGHLSQIVWNLLLNAAEAIQDDGRIDIKIYPVRNSHVCIQISDNGYGIPGDCLDSICTPFFTTKPNGTGLGLSIVHSILESYDGWMNVESETNKGTTLILNLKPLAPPT